MYPTTSQPTFELQPGTVHLWHASALNPSTPPDAYLYILDEEERARAARFHFSQDRIRFLQARTSIRRLLARYTNSDPAAIRFQQNDYGKPFLRSPASSVRFNITHSGDCIVHAITDVTEVGVDVEHIRESAALWSTSTYFGAEERAYLGSLNAHQRDLALFRLWVCKEAYVKAVGTGLSKPLNSFTIDVSCDARPKLIFDSDDRAAPTSWRLLAFEPEKDVVGCVALGGDFDRFELYEY